MKEQHTEDKVTWIQLNQPTAEEIHEVMTEFSVPPSLMNDLSAPVFRSSVTSSGKAVRLTMNFPIVKRTDIDRAHEIKFIVAKNYLITVQYEEMEALDRFKKAFEVITTLHKASKRTTGAHLFKSLMREIYNSSDSKLDYIETRLVDIETEIFNEHEKQMVLEISKISKRLISFRQILKSHDGILRDSKPLFAAVFKKAFTEDLEDIHVHYFHILRRTTALFETLEELRNTNSALLTTKQNEIMKTLTIMAFITFPLTLFTSMFGMNTTTTPILGQKGDFWIILGAMTVVTIGFFTFFKYKKWM